MRHSGPRTQGPGPRTPRSMDPGPRTQDARPSTPDPGLRTQDPGRPGPRTRGPGPRTHVYVLSTERPCVWGYLTRRGQSPQLPEALPRRYGDGGDNARRPVKVVVGANVKLLVGGGGGILGILIKRCELRYVLPHTAHVRVCTPPRDKCTKRFRSPVHLAAESSRRARSTDS